MTPFPHTLQTLGADRPRRLLFWLLLAAALVICWGAWCFIACVPVYAVSNDTQLVAPDRVVATFAPVDTLHMQPGQRARLFLDGFPIVQYGSLSATVARIDENLRDGRVVVELACTPPSQSTVPLRAGMRGRIEVQVEQVAPLTLLLRSLG